MHVQRLMACVLVLGTAVWGRMPLVYAEGEPARQVIENFIQEIRAMEFPVKDPVKHQQLVEEANAALDLDSMGQKALAQHWQKAAPEEQKAFLDLMWKLIENVAYPRSHKFMGAYKITYPEIKPAGRGFEVHSVVKGEEQALDASVVYHVYPQNTQWKVDDVALDGVSIIEDLKYQFDKIIAQSKFSGLLEKMKERLAQAEKENGVQA